MGAIPAARLYHTQYRELPPPPPVDTHFSLNSLIDKSEYSVSYTRIDDAIEIIKRLRRGSLMNQTDIVDAFKVLPIRLTYGDFME